MFEMSLSLESTFSKPNIRSVFKNETAQIGFSVVSVLVTRFLQSFGFSTKPDPTQIEMITVDTLENFSYESLEDIILFFKMARSGKFGETNRGVDSNLIFGKWFPMYLEQKAILREQEYQKEKALISKVQATDEDVSKTYKRINDAQYKIKVVEYVDKIVLNMDRQLLEDTIADWEKDEEKKQWVYLLKEKRRKV